jgi:carboxylesterase type B
MTIQIVRDMLFWCSIINIVFLLWWFLVLTCAHDWIYRFHGKWFKLPVENFDAIHYAGIAFYKICIFLFNIVPYIALHIVA